jgi:hypothetical protein
MYVRPAGKILTIRGPWNIRERFSPQCDGRRQAIDLRFVTGLFLVPDWEMEVDSEPGFFGLWPFERNSLHLQRDPGKYRLGRRHSRDRLRLTWLIEK